MNSTLVSLAWSSRTRAQPRARRRRGFLRAGLVAMLILVPATALAQAVGGEITNYVPEGDIKQQPAEVGSGFDGTLAVAANLNLASNSNVVGQVDGFSTLFGASVLAGLDYISGLHEWRNTLKITQSWARTPVIDEFIKNNDVLDLESIYNYFLATWTGPFARLNLQTSVLPAEDIRAEPQSYLITRQDGTVDTVTNESRLGLASAFSPLTLNESVGWFVEPIQYKAFAVSIRLGAGARETFADGVLAVSDKDGTPEIETLELSDVYQAGAEAFVGFGGKEMEDRLTYDVGASIMFPLVTNDDQDRSVMELARYGLAASASASVFDWMALTYQLKLLKDPQLLDELQAQHALLLSFQYTLIDRTPPPPPPKADPAEAEAAAEKMQKQLKDAEERAKQAEQKALEAEARAKAAEAAKAPTPDPTEPAPTEPTDPEPEPEP